MIQVVRSGDAFGPHAGTVPRTGSGAVTKFRAAKIGFGKASVQQADVAVAGGVGRGNLPGKFVVVRIVDAGLSSDLDDLEIGERDAIPEELFRTIFTDSTSRIGVKHLFPVGTSGDIPTPFVGLVDQRVESDVCVGQVAAGDHLCLKFYGRNTGEVINRFIIEKERLRGFAEKDFEGISDFHQWNFDGTFRVTPVIDGHCPISILGEGGGPKNQ